MAAAAQPDLSVDRPPNYGISMSMVEDRVMSAHKQRWWLERSKQWRGFGAPNDWEPVKVLGGGVNGICGLWRYTGINPAMPNHIVAKQSKVTETFPPVAGGRWVNEELRIESKLLRDIMDAGPANNGFDHIVKLYQSAYTEGGSGTSKEDERDPWPFNAQGNFSRSRQISRMLIEYCENGDLRSELKEIEGSIDDPLRPSKRRRRSGVMDTRSGAGWQRTKQIIPEESVWRIFGCLANALVILRYGTENQAMLPGWQEPIAHFDIKPANMIGTHDNGTHQKLPIYKLADFGLALPVNPAVVDTALWNAWPAANKQEWIENTQWRAPATLMAPEQVLSNYDMMFTKPARRIGLTTNVWQVGAVMYEIMTFKELQENIVDPWDRTRLALYQEFFLTDFPAPNGGIERRRACGRELTETGYSKLLINLVNRCLAYDYRDRPAPFTLLNEIQTVLNSNDIGFNRRGLRRRLQLRPEPTDRRAGELYTQTEKNKLGVTVKKYGRVPNYADLSENSRPAQPPAESLVNPLLFPAPPAPAPNVVPNPNNYGVGAGQWAAAIGDTPGRAARNLYPSFRRTTRVNAGLPSVDRSIYPNVPDRTR